MRPRRRTAGRVVVACAALFTACSRPPEPTATATSGAGPDASAVRYLALGDSFTIGTGSEPSQSFPSRLAQRWGASGCDVALKNLGVNGYTTEDVIDAELPEIAPFAPTFVTLAVGANDIVHRESAETYRAHVRRILTAVIAAGVHADRIVALSQPEWSLSPAATAFGDVATLGRSIVAFNAVLQEEATAAGARFVDLSLVMHREGLLRMVAGDGLHPSAAAYDEWSVELSRAVPAPCGAPR